MSRDQTLLEQFIQAAAVEVEGTYTIDACVVLDDDTAWLAAYDAAASEYVAIELTRNSAAGGTLVAATHKQAGFEGLPYVLEAIVRVSEGEPLTV